VLTTGQRISYRTMVDRSRQLANVFRSQGLRPGDHVAIFMTNLPEYSDDYAEVVAKAETTPAGPELEGQAMLYSSGTTGRPKGIVHTKVDVDRRFGDVSGDILWVNRYGGTVAVLPKFDAEETLKAIEKYRVTHVQFVPTMFIRPCSSSTLRSMTSR
jgi:acyl-CoA synthetase (AMP-forming)/AMP-acid ligase II